MYISEVYTTIIDITNLDSNNSTNDNQVFLHFRIHELYSFWYATNLVSIFDVAVWCFVVFTAGLGKASSLLNPVLWSVNTATLELKTIK